MSVLAVNCCGGTPSHPAPDVHIPRVGRTARGRDGKGRALLMLMPEELGFLKYLKAAKVITNFPTKQT